jgi:predicted amidohydrolase
MKIALAQTRPLNKSINENLDDHYHLVHLANEQQASLIVFPEMSVTGYIRENSDKLSFTKHDARLDRLKKLSGDNNIIIIAGAPIKMDSGLYIGSFILFPDGSELMYTKQFLHNGEADFYVPGSANNPQIQLGTEKISLAICADIDHPIHAENASKRGSTIYIASIFFSINGIAGAYRQLSNYAQKHSMQVMMSNFCGNTWNTESAGKSAFWGANGTLVAGLDGENTGLVIAEKKDGGWSGTSIIAAI